jgi:hypothetical protein
MVAIILMNTVHRHIPGGHAGTAVVAEDDDNHDGVHLPRTDGGFEKRYDVRNWSALAVAHHAGIDHSRRRTRLRRPRAGLSGSRTRAPGEIL